MKILFLQAGGTIDKDYPAGDDHHGYHFLITDPAYERILGRIKPSFAFETRTVLKKDSLDMSDDDRKLLLRVCEESDADKIIITHGTDTMLQTAEVLSDLEDKTVVLTGALSPEMFKGSDAEFNLGSAVASASILDPGIYVTMNGLIRPWHEIEYNNAAGRFITKAA